MPHGCRKAGVLYYRHCWYGKWFVVAQWVNWIVKTCLTLLTGWKNWLAQYYKTEGDHLKKWKSWQLCCCYIMPTHHLCTWKYENVINNNKLKMHPWGVPTFKKKKKKKKKKNLLKMQVKSQAKMEAKAAKAATKARQSGGTLNNRKDSAWSSIKS